MHVGRISIDPGFLESRVARRVFGVFIACALIPVLAFALFAYREVRDQLDRDAAEALRATSKASGMAILERLLLADDSLRIRTSAAAASRDETRRGALRPLPGVEALPAEDPRIESLAARDREHLADGRGILQLDVSSGTARLLILRQREADDVAAGVWIGEIDPANVFADGLEPAGGRLWVQGPGGAVLHVSPDGWRPPRYLPSAKNRSVALLEIASEASLVACWDLFLASTFRAEKWTVFVSRPLADVHRPLREFQAVFPWIVGITLCFALSLSLSQIRRTLVPIGALTEGARRVAGGDFDVRVDVSTHDEFGTLSKAFNEMAEVIGRQVEVLLTVNRIGAALSAERDTRRIVDNVLQGSMQTTRAQGGALFLLTDEGNLELSQVLLKAEPIVLGQTLEDALPRGPMKHCLESRAAILQDVSLLDEEERLQWQALEGYLGEPITGYLCIPLGDEKRQNLGVLFLLRTGFGTFGADQLALAESLASQAAVAIRKNQLVESFRGLFEGLIQLTVGAIDEKSAYTGSHCRKVPVITELIADAACADRVGPLKDFDLTPEERYELRIAALLHDCGKVVTPVHVMDKRTKLETISDRIELIETRFEVLRRDALIRRFERHLADAGLEVPAQDEPELSAEVSGLDDDMAFLREMNIGGERMPDSSCERVRAIARRYHWTTRSGEDRDALDTDEIKNLLIRRGTLNDDERKAIEQHVVATMRMLQRLPFPSDLRNVPAIAGAHHERIDGSGYPLRLRGEQLSVQARILGLADIFEALTARDRPYKPGMKLRETLDILESMSRQGHIDPMLLELFLREKLHLRYAAEHMSPEQIDPEFQNELEELTGP